ncbi:hypothetical protein Vadar_017532 [Vaccinium darrowii]|uniref:Uncharacterized protein n=1 Tax=Vaccinium darrowii TaxID=229202 RepID=A0ACB7ZDA0_9ERIC|nr:hypothetical protein Vadar_017532 [Vaccinium darrowii]
MPTPSDTLPVSQLMNLDSYVPEFIQYSLNLVLVKQCLRNVIEWHALASWTWDAQDETCGMLKMKHVGCSRMAFDGGCPDCKLPGDDCPLMDSAILIPQLEYIWRIKLPRIVKAVSGMYQVH